MLREGQLLSALGNKAIHAFHCFTRAAELGCAAAYGHLAHATYHAYGTREDEKLSANLARRGIELNDPQSMVMLSRLHRLAQGGLPRDHHRAHALLEQSWQLGCSAVMLDLAWCLQWGRGDFGVDRPRHARIMQRAADLDDPRAVCSLGLAYLNGSGVAVDTERGMNLVRRAAALGDHWAMNELGDIYLFGHMQGVENKSDPATARTWFARAAALGNPNAARALLLI